MSHSARVWNYWLGGKDNYLVDRQAGDRIAEMLPEIVTHARADRAFLGRAVRFLAGEAGIRQFLDIGAGLPSMDNTHEVAQRIAPDCQMVYVDNDPLVLAHARALLTGTPPGATSPPSAFIGADCDYVRLADGRWGLGLLIPSSTGGWARQPEIGLDSEAYRDRDAWTRRDGAMDLRLRVAARIPVVTAGLRVTSAGRARVTGALRHDGLLAVMERLASRFGLDLGTLAWQEAPEPARRNNSRSASYQVSADGLEGRAAVTGALWFMLPAGIAENIQAAADLRVSFDAIRPAPPPPAGGLTQILANCKSPGPN